MTRPVTPVKASVPAELPEPELQEQASSTTVLKKRAFLTRVPSQIRPHKGARWTLAELQRLRDALPTDPIPFARVRAIVEALDLDSARGASLEVSVRLVEKLRQAGMLVVLPHPTIPRRRLYQRKDDA